MCRWSCLLRCVGSTRLAVDRCNVILRCIFCKNDFQWRPPLIITPYQYVPHNQLFHPKIRSGVEGIAHSHQAGNIKGGHGRDWCLCPRAG
jgi:hypothetical protein